MKFAIVFAAALAVASAQNYFGSTPPTYYQPTPRYQSTARPPVVVNRPASSDAAANIVRFENDIGPDGSYSYAYETDNGIAAQAQGTPRDFGGNPPVVPVVSQGSFGWTSPEGQTIGISYVADENGYQPKGDAIPTPHPIPPAIVRALEYITRNPEVQKYGVQN